MNKRCFFCGTPHQELELYCSERCKTDYLKMNQEIRLAVARKEAQRGGRTSAALGG